MGIVQAEITLRNVTDEVKARLGLIKTEEIRTTAVTAVVDTGSMHLVITEDLRQELGLVVKGERIAHVANGQRINCKITETVEVHWKDRETTLPALVIPGAEKVLLGAMPLEGMDLMVNPVSQELVGVHGDKIEWLVL